MTGEGLRAVIPGQLRNGLLVWAAFLFVEFLHLEVDFRSDVAVGQSHARGIDRFVPPLVPATAVDDAPLLLNGGGAGQHKDLRLDLFGIHSRSTPEGTGLVVIKIDVDHPVQFGHGLTDLVGMGATAGGVHAPGEETSKFPFVHRIKKIEPGIVGSVIELGKQIVGLVQGGVRPVHGPEETGHILGLVFPPVEAVGFLGRRSLLFVV
ncbi:MAG: hypothetical protein A4E72_01259 [Syntrophus sp. PtaU1.Bin208]|nr:MAG: hypothetical protein A4E72_01259 [Syntrophus sp. PtaU1.Bin208]